MIDLVGAYGTTTYGQAASYDYATSRFSTGTVASLAETSTQTSSGLSALASDSTGGGRVIEDKVSLSKEGKNALSALEAFEQRQATGMALANANLTALNLSGGDYSEAVFSENSLVRANLNNSTFTDATFTGADLRYATFINSDVSGANFAGADLRGTNFSGSYGLTAEQLRYAKIGADTVLPSGLIS